MAGGIVTGSQAGLAPADVKMFVLDQSSQPGELLERSVGVRNAAYGVVHAVASRQAMARNAIVITHELLHILGATDKYDMRSGQPLPPDGLANPGQSPLYPQQRAEIMAGRVPLNAREALMPGSLKEVVIGPATASEIRLQR